MSGADSPCGTGGTHGPSAPTLFSQTGLLYYPVTLVARLPFSMLVVGVLTLVVSTRGSIELGGLNSAMVGIGVACVGPFIGAAADHFGQRPTLLIAGAVNSAVLGALAWIAYSPAPVWALFVASFLVGATAPQIAPMSRSRLVDIITTRLPVRQRPRLISNVLAFESAAEESVYVFGPVAVGALATAFGGWAPVVGAAILTITFITAFALHRTSIPVNTREERAATLAPASELRRPALLITVIGACGTGMFFGSMLTSLTAFMQDRGAAESAGLLYGVLGIGSALCSIGVTLLPARFSLRARWLVFALMMLVGTALLQTVHDLPSMALCLAYLGIGIGPLLVNFFTLAAHRSPAGRSATVMTMLSSGLMLGQAAASATTGVVATHLGTRAALLLPLIAVTLILIAGLVNWVLSRAPHPAH
ncbi:MAG: MFS transporter [Leucobacter sp.]